MERIDIETPVYLSIDIDVIDPGLSPGTGTPEPGGWTTRETIKIVRGIERLNVVGADVVEISPACDGRGEETALAASHLVYEMITSIVKKGFKQKGLEALQRPGGPRKMTVAKSTAKAEGKSKERDEL